MKFQIFIFFVWVSCFNIVSSYHQYQEFGNGYQQHPDRSMHTNYPRNTPMYPANSQSLNHARPSHVTHYALQSKLQYEPHHQRRVSSFEFPIPPAEQAYSPDYSTQHIAKPWQNTYQPTHHQEPYEPQKSYNQPPVQQKSHNQTPVQQEPYRQPIVYPEQEPSVYQYPKALQQAQTQHPTPHQRPPHLQTYYEPQTSYAVPAANAQAQAYAISETDFVDILASKTEVEDYLESALLKRYQLDDLGNSHHVQSNDIKLEDNNIERTTEKPYNYHQNNKLLQQLLDNDHNQNKKLHVPKNNNHFVNPQTIFEETKHETILPKNDDSETINHIKHPRFDYLNHKKKPTEVKTFPIEVKPVNPHHYRYPIVKHHPHANYPYNSLDDEKQKPLVPPTSVGNTDDSYPFEPQHSKIYETSTFKDKEDTLYDYDVPAHEHHSKKQPEPTQYTDKIHPENDYTIKHTKIPSHSKRADQTIVDNPVDKSVDTSSHGINKPKDSIVDVSPLLFYSDINDDTKAPLITSPNFNYDKPYKESYSDLKEQREVAKPTTDTTDFDVITDPIVSQIEDPEKIFSSEIDVTKATKIDDKKQTINNNVSDNGDKQQKAESEPRSTLPKDIAKQSPIEGSPLNVDSPTDDGTTTEQNDDCTSDEIDPNTNADDEEAAADSENDINAVLLSSTDLWEKLFSKQPNTEFQAYNVVTLSPIVEKTSRLYAFPNQTTVEESVETVWACKGDALPLEIKLTTIIRNPKQKRACKSDKIEQDQTKCD